MRTIHTVEDITDGNKTVTLADLIKAAEKSNVSADKVFVCVSDSRLTQYRDLFLVVNTENEPEESKGTFDKFAGTSPRNRRIMSV